jgi:hypothetical protein
MNVHAKTTLTEPARPRRWQLSEAGTRVAKALTLKRQAPAADQRTARCQPLVDSETARLNRTYTPLDSNLTGLKMI